MNLSSQEKNNLESLENPKQLLVYSNLKGLKSVESKVFGKYLSNGQTKVLDVGCGMGRTTNYIDKLGHNVVGIDLSPAMIEKAKDLYPVIDFRVMDVCDLSFPDDFFDTVVFSFNGLDCIYPEEKRWKAVKEMKRVLKKDGLLILSSHNRIVWPTNRYTFFWWFLNFITGRIFTSYQYDWKGFRNNIRFLYFGRFPYFQIRDFEKRGFVFKEIFSKPDHSILKGTKNMFLINIFDPWPYFVFTKK
jgi:SAM-dependent methyltransferase